MRKHRPFSQAVLFLVMATLLLFCAFASIVVGWVGVQPGPYQYGTQGGTQGGAGGKIKQLVELESTIYAEDGVDQGYVGKISTTSWAEARNATTGAMGNDTAYTSGEASSLNYVGFSYWAIYRLFFAFDLSGLGIPSSVESVKMYLYNTSYSGDRTARVQQGTQSLPLADADYNNFTGSAFASKTWSTSAEYQEISLNAAGIAYIMSMMGSGTAKLCVRDSRDYDNSEPSAPTIVHAEGAAFSSMGAGTRPKLVINAVY